MLAAALSRHMYKTDVFLCKAAFAAQCEAVDPRPFYFLNGITMTWISLDVEQNTARTNMSPVKVCQHGVNACAPQD